MSFPDEGNPVPESSSGSNIAFSQLRTAYNNGGGWETVPADGDARLFPGTDESGNPTIMSLGDFRRSTFTSGDPVPSSGFVSIGTHFCGKTFGPEGGGGGGGGETEYTITFVRSGESSASDSITINIGGVDMETPPGVGESSDHVYSSESDTVTIIFVHGEMSHSIASFSNMTETTEFSEESGETAGEIQFDEGSTSGTIAFSTD